MGHECGGCHKMALLNVETVLLGTVIAGHYNLLVSLCSLEKHHPPAMNGCSLVTSTMSSVIGHSGSCRLRGQPVDMPLVGLQVFPLSCLLIQ